VAPYADREHLSSRKIQEFLDRQLTPREEVAAREHLDSCARCRGELQGWKLLFSDLESLPKLEPGPALREEVMAQAPSRLPMGDRARQWLAARKKGEGSGVAHVPASSLQDFLDGRLPPQPRARVEAHLASCAGCANALEEWTALVHSFESLKPLAPSPGFRERVMEQVMVPLPVPAQSPGMSGVREWIAAWARSLVPHTRHGWAVIGGLASAPTITLAALVYLVFSRPQVTPGALGSYLFWKGSELLQTLAGSLSALARENGTLQAVVSFLEPVARSPFLLGLGGVGLSLLSAAALWVLYRNLFATPSDGRHARARV